MRQVVWPLFYRKRRRGPGTAGADGAWPCLRVHLAPKTAVYQHPVHAKDELVLPATPPSFNFNLFEANLSLHLPYPRLLPSELNADQLPLSDSAEAF